jgi:hypothetical protein
MTLVPENAAVVSAAQAIRASAIRTWTPMVLALVVKALDFFHVEIRDNVVLTQAIEVLLSSAIALAFYIVVRVLEILKSSKWGKILLGLGISAAPVYATPPSTVSAVQAAAPDVEIL